MKSTIRKSIDIDKRYILPNNIKVIRYREFFLIIAVDYANWIVLENESQMSFFNLLKVQSIRTALEYFDGNRNDAVEVVKQLEARRFEDKVTNRIKEEKVHLYLTNACNMRCPHCYMSAGNKVENELTTDEIKSLLSEFRKCGGDKICFSGGEIATRKDLIEIIEHGHRIGLKIELLTNGVLWTDPMISAVSPLVERVQISIDGYSEKENSKVRGEGNFCKALNTVDKFIQNGVRTEITVTPMYESILYNRYKRYVKFAKDLLNKYQGRPFHIMFTGELLDGREITLTDKQAKLYHDKVEKILYECYGIQYDDPFIDFHKKGGLQDNCAFGCLNISANGYVYACAAVSLLNSFANVRNDNMERIMEISNEIKRASNVDNLTPCNSCELKYICGGECRIKYFPDLKTLTKIGMSEMSRSIKCDKKQKEFYYDLMIRTNKKIFR